MESLRGYFSDPDPIRTRVRVLTAAQPPAGAEWTAQPDNLRAWKVLAALGSLTTAVAVANRFPGLVIHTDGQDIWQGAVPTAITASLTVPVSYAPEVTSASQATAAWPAQLEIPEMWLPPGSTVSSKTPGLQAADQYAATQLLVLEAWPSPHERQERDQRAEQLARQLGLNVPFPHH